MEKSARRIRRLVVLLLSIIIIAFTVLGIFLSTSTVSQQEFFSPFQSFFSKNPLQNPQPQEKDHSYPPLGVMIENELLARPFQTGLSQADIVYEAPAEGGITRFLTIFRDKKHLGKLGPVRSARTYFLDWMHEYKGVFVHVGGNPDVLARLRKEKIYNADQFFYEKDTYFWRENIGKTALEHTMFTSGTDLKRLIQDQNWEKVSVEDSLSRKKARIFGENLKIYPKAQKISIDFGFPTYRVDYSYDEATRRYLRFQAKKPHIDYGNNIQINAATIVIQRVKSWPNNDEEGSISIQTIGEGEATIFQLGRAIKGRWKKEKLDERTKFFNDLEEEISSADFPIWVEVLPLQNSFTFQGAPPLKIPVLMYHYIGTISPDQKNNAFRKDLTVSSEDFEAQLKWLKENGYFAVSFSDVGKFIGAQEKFSLRKKSIALTFDDGYEDAYTNAFPLLKKYGFRGAFAVITNKINTKGYLTWEQIAEMKKSGMEFLSHTHSHLDLRTLTDKKLHEELTASKQILENKLGKSIDGFVYPAGKYDRRVIEAVKKAGYKMARTTKNNLVTAESAIYELPVLRIHGNTTIEQFKILLKLP